MLGDGKIVTEAHMLVDLVAVKMYVRISAKRDSAIDSKPNLTTKPQSGERYVPHIS
jgi:hypothetical protein